MVKGTIYNPWIKGDKQYNNKGKDLPQKNEELMERFKLLQDRSIRWLYEERMNKEIDVEYDGNTEEIYDYILKKVKKISYEVLGKENIQKAKLNNWITIDVLEKN